MENKRIIEPYILSLSSFVNPAVFKLQDQFKYIDSLEIVRTRIESSEYTCEFYRNCPFLILFNDYENLCSCSYDNFMYQLGINSLSFETLKNILDKCLFENKTSYFIERNLFYNYTPTTTTIECVSGSCKYGIAPFVLDSINYTIDSLKNALNLNTFNYICSLINIPFITAQIDSNGFFNFVSSTPFYIFPSNAHKIVGLASNKIYVSTFHYPINKFIVRGEYKPSIIGSDMIYIQNEESLFNIKNPSFSSLGTVYFIGGDYTDLDHQVTSKFIRKVQMNSSTVNKLTLGLYSDIENKFLYQNHNRKWFIDICIRGLCS